MVSVYIETYGCTLNQSESEAITRTLHGHSLVNKPLDAQVIVLNTCVVTEITERKILRRIADLYSSRDNRALIITGCAASVLRADLQTRYPKATLVESRSVASYINSHFQTESAAHGRDDINNVTTRVKIAEGCQGQCSYCIVRLARGRTQSKPVGVIAHEIELAMQRGAKQVLLAAQDAGVYGADIGSSLPELINALCSLRSDFKLRVGMMNVSSVRHITTELLNAFDHPRVYKFLHLPVQSGSDRILRLMERGHTVSDFKRCVSAFEQRFPEITLSTDFIVGFPTETENEFKSTMKLLRATKPVKVNITRFSPRAGTAAASFDLVTSRIVKDRSRTLTIEHHRIAYRKNCRLIGKSYSAFAAERGKNGSTVLYNDNYRPIVSAQALPLGLFYTIKITRATPTYLRGDIQ
ncbi:MAG: tRNA (N(6)-L-threonylcarbamoyladenosine(37)-C(2))-methylthiotransferase [Halobacteriota archaeon]